MRLQTKGGDQGLGIRDAWISAAGKVDISRDK
jgi:hypothetical protein